MNFLKRYEEGVVKHCRKLARVPDRYNPSPERVLEVIRLSLSDHIMIDEVIWGCLVYADPRVKNSVCRKVYDYGWEHDKNTQKLKQIFQSFLRPTEPIDWESYL